MKYVRVSNFFARVKKKSTKNITLFASIYEFLQQLNNYSRAPINVSLLLRDANTQSLVQESIKDLPMICIVDSASDIIFKIDSSKQSIWFKFQSSDLIPEKYFPEFCARINRIASLIGFYLSIVSWTLSIQSYYPFLTEDFLLNNV